MREFFISVHSVKHESEIVELMNTLTDLLLNFRYCSIMSNLLYSEFEIFQIEDYLCQIFNLLSYSPGTLIYPEISSSDSKQKLRHQASTPSEMKDSLKRTEKSHDNHEDMLKSPRANLHPPTPQLSIRFVLEKEIKENIIWIINAIFEQNYGPDMIELYKRLKVEELVRG